jgi:hypothetical protein
MSPKAHRFLMVILVWDGRAASGAQVGSGVYFCRLSCSGETRTRNLVLVR